VEAFVFVRIDAILCIFNVGSKVEAEKIKVPFKSEALYINTRFSSGDSMCPLSAHGAVLSFNNDGDLMKIMSPNTMKKLDDVHLCAAV
jgi:hypothetical protein